MNEQKELYEIHTPRSDKEGFKLPRVRAKSSDEALDIFEEKHTELYYAYGLNKICIITKAIKPQGERISANRHTSKPPVTSPSKQGGK